MERLNSHIGSTSFLLFRPPFGAQNKGYQQAVKNYLIANWPYEAYVQEVGRWTGDRLEEYRKDEYAKQDELPTKGLPVLRIYTGLVPWNDYIITAIYPELAGAVRVIRARKQNDFNHRVIKAIQSGKL